MSSAVDATGNPIPSSTVLTASAKHIGMRCMPENVAFLKCKKNDPNPEKCLEKGRDVTRCVLGLEFPREMNVFLKDIVPAAQNNINTHFIILDKARSPAANDKNCIALAADETAAVHIQLWGDECDAFEAGDILKLTNGIFSFVRNSGLVLRAGKHGKMEKMGEFAIAFVETPNVSEIQWNPDPENPKRYIQNVVVSAYSRIFPPLS